MQDYAGDFAILAEGRTDQLVIRSVLWGFFEDDEPVINFVRPLDETATGARDFGGWTVLVKTLRQDVRDALTVNKYAVVHIDLDIAADLGVALNDSQGSLSPERLHEDVVKRLCRLIGDDIMAVDGSRILFALGVDSTECWLLPLVYDSSKKTTRQKVTGCLDAMNKALSKQGQPALTNRDGKVPDVYRKLARAFERRKFLDQLKDANLGLRRFLDQLAALKPESSAD